MVQYWTAINRITAQSFRVTASQPRERSPCEAVLPQIDEVEIQGAWYPEFQVSSQRHRRSAARYAGAILPEPNELTAAISAASKTAARLAPIEATPCPAMS
jgi:hypothetical protein